MARLYLTFKDNELTASVEGIATTDTIGLECVAEFHEWDGFSKTVVFYQNPRKPYRVVVHADETLFEVPHEVLLSDAPLTIGAFGVNAEGKRKTSTVAGINITKGMFDEKAVESIKPTPSEYEQMLAFMNAYMEAEKLVDNVADAVQKATEDAREEIDSATAAAIELAKEAVDEKSAEEQREIEAVGEAIIKRAEDAADAAEVSSVAAANSVGRISSVEKRLTNIEQSITPSPFVVDDTVAYSKTVPANALPYAEINKIGGVTRKCTNLIPYPYMMSTKTISGVAFTDNGDGSITVNGTATDKIYYQLNNVTYRPNRTYVLHGCPSGGAVDKYRLYDDVVKIMDTSEGAVYSSAEKKQGKIYIFIESGATVTNLVFKPTLNESSTALPFETYFSGLISAPVTEVKSIGVAPTDSASLPIPAAIRNLNGYGWSVSESIYNYVDFEKKQFVKRVERVDMGTLQWMYDSMKRWKTFDIASAVKTDKFYPPLLAEKYPTSRYWYNEECTITMGDANTICIMMPSGSPAPTGMLYYELAEPIVEDISDKLPLDNYIEVFEGGSVVMENEHKLAVPNKITYQTKGVTL